MFKCQQLYFVWSENKGTDQLSEYGTAELHLCFHNHKAGFLMI